jgi:tripartite ATP-independent transporter DctP family solute receptor
MLRSISLAGTILLAVLAGCDRTGGNPKVKVATVLPESHPSGAVLKFFKERVEELSGGTMDVALFFNSTLGGANETLEQCQDGSLELAHVSTTTISTLIPVANALTMPYIWRDSEHQYKALDGEIGDVLRELAKEHDFEVMGFFDAGTRNVTTKEGPIKVPSDLEGMKIRVMSAPLMVDTIEAMGASATPMNQGEVYTSLETGMLDGWENNPMTIVTFRMYETGCIYFAWTKHFSIPDVFIAGKPFLDRLTPEQRGWVEQAARETVVKQREMWNDSEDEMLQTMLDNGMKINEVDLDIWRETVQPIYPKYYEKYGDEFQALCEKIKSIE